MRTYLKIVNIFFLGLASCAVSPFHKVASPVKNEINATPNVIFIVADQFRGDALSILGHPDIETPVLDKMASEGVAFRNHFANNPVCTPSRMSMWSSKYPHEHGTLTNRPGVKFANRDNTMLGFFAEKGYRMGWFGKDNHSFDKSVLDATLDSHSNLKREPFRSYYSTVPPHWYSNTPWPKEQLYAYRLTDDLISFIDESGEDPFFGMLSLFDPHPPYFAPSEYVSKYLKKDLHIPAYVKPSDLGERFSTFWKAMNYDSLEESDLRAAMAHYYAAIEWGVDAQLGRLLDALVEKGKDQNTIIAFTSEHGDYMGQHGGLRKSMFLHDALLHVPMIWYAPSIISPLGALNDLSQGIDIFPTIVELIGHEPDDSHSGRSHAKRLSGSSSTPVNSYLLASAGYDLLPDNYFDEPEMYFTDVVDEDTRPFHTRIFHRVTQPKYKTLSVRTHQWKLILSETEDPQLYEVGPLIKERTNVAGKVDLAETINELSEIAHSNWDWSSDD